jgi:soluble lytic murein transglycosylase-like protein
MANKGNAEILGGSRRILRFLSVLGVPCVLCVLCLQSFSADFALLRNGFEIRHERQEAAGANTRLYFSTSSDSGYIDIPSEEIAGYRPDDTPPSISSTATTPALKSSDFRTFVNAASDRHLVDADLITSVIRAESDFNPQARSPKGAQGLMQLMPGTASSLGVKDAYEPATNIDAGTRYLRELLLRYNDDIAKALAAYNAGPYRVTQYHGVPPYRETHAYVARVIRDFNQKKLSAKKVQGKAAKTPKKSTSTSLD